MAYTFVRSAGNASSSASSLTATLAAAPASGDLVVAVVGSSANNITLPTSTSATWTLAVKTADGQLAIYYSTTVTTAAITANASSASHLGFNVLHATSTAGPLVDQTNSAAAASPGSITPTQNNEFIVAGDMAGSNPTAPTGYTALASGQGDGTFIWDAAWLNQGTAAATTAAWSAGTRTVVASFGAVVTDALAGTGAIKTAGTGTLATTAPLAGTGAIKTAGTGTLSNVPPGALAGSGAIATAGTGTLTVTKPLAGAGAITTAGTGGMTAVGATPARLTITDEPFIRITITDEPFIRITITEEV